MKDISPQPNVSVALATFNGLRFLPELLCSVLDQSYPVMEIVVSDDGSTDGTYEYLVSQANSHDRIRLLPKHSRKGYVSNFATAIAACRGDYVALCDQDDVWFNSKVELLTSSIGSNDAITGNALITDSDLKPTGIDLRIVNNIVSGAFNFTSILHHNRFTGCTMMFQTSIRERAIPFPKNIAHDWWIALLAVDGNGLAYINEPLVYYRQHENNVLGITKADTESADTRGRQICNRTGKRLERLLAMHERSAVLSDAAKKDLSRAIRYHVLFFIRRFSLYRIYLAAYVLWPLPENRSLSRRMRIVLRSICGYPECNSRYRSTIARAKSLLKKAR